MTNNELTVKLKSMLSKQRYEHSIGVQATAVRLAVLNNTDVDKASIAGLVHDCAKCMNRDTLLKIARENCGIEIDVIYWTQPELLHGAVGAYIAQNKFSIVDDEILHSVRYHTTGCENMSILDKIIYIADYIEPGRDFPGVNALRELTFKDIDKGVISALDNTIRYVMERGQLIDINTIKARNSIIIDKRHSIEGAKT